MNKERLKESFKGNYSIKEVIDYIDMIDSNYLYEFNNVKCNVYYSKKQTKINKSKIKRVIKRAQFISNKSKNFIINLILSLRFNYDRIYYMKYNNS